MFLVIFILIEVSIWRTIQAARPSGKQLFSVFKKICVQWAQISKRVRYCNACYSLCCSCTVTCVECCFLITAIVFNGILSSAMRFLTSHFDVAYRFRYFFFIKKVIFYAIVLL